MENTRAHEIIVEALQQALATKLNDNVNLHHIADAIAVKVEFEKSYSNGKNDKVTGLIIDIIVKRSEEMKTAVNDLNEDETLLKNFILGKLTAYDEILKIINTL